jgi:molybdate transport system substrate-binding protein
MVRLLRREILAALAALALLLPAGAGRAQEGGPLVFAAASLTTALDQINAAFRQQGGAGAVISYASSSVLAKQIAAAAPADLFISADQDWMDFVAGRNLIRADSRRDLLGNALVLIAPADSPATLQIGPGFPLDALVGGGRLAMGDPASVPAGRYGKASLEALGVWDRVKDHLALAENVRAALALVSRREAPFGIVYRSDAVSDRGVKVVGTFPEASHPPIVYPAALVATSTNPAAATFLAFLSSPAAKAIFEAQGFTVLAP